MSSDGSEINSESKVSGRTLVNLHLQDELVIFADSWAKALEAKAVTKSVRNVQI